MHSVDRTVFFHPLFDCDIRAAGLWYRDHASAAKGEEFARRVQEWVEQIALMPERYAVVENVCRVARVPGFPYYILYDCSDTEVNFHAVIHTSRSPQNWVERKAK